MGGIIKVIKVRDGITIKVRDKNMLLVADRIVADGEEMKFVKEDDRLGKKIKEVLNGK